MPLKPDAPRNKVIVALKRAIEATFDDARWLELGYLVDRVDVVEHHPRLLRSLRWSDSDYPSCVLQVLPALLGTSTDEFGSASDDNLAVVEQFVGLQSWLRKHDSALHAELYGGEDTIPLEQVEHAAAELDVVELTAHVARIRRGIRDDPAQAIGSAKELLETTLKTVLGEHGAKSNEDLLALLKRAQKELDLDPKTINMSLPGAETMLRTLSNLGQVVQGVSELRNLYGTGHGRSKTPEVEQAHARLVVNSASTVATYFLELWQANKR
jgi:hypothetical protein